MVHGGYIVYGLHKRILSSLFHWKRNGSIIMELNLNAELFDMQTNAKIYMAGKLLMACAMHRS